MQPDEPSIPEEDLEPLEELRPGDEVVPGLPIQEAAEGEVLPRPVVRRSRPGRSRRRRSSGRVRYHAFGVGEVLGKGLTIWGKNLLPFSLLSLLVFSPLLVYVGWTATNDVVDETSVPHDLILWAVPFLLEWLVTAALIYGVFQQLRHRRATLGACFSNGLSRLLPVIGVSLAMGFCIAIAYLPIVLAIYLYITGGEFAMLGAFFLAVIGGVLVAMLMCALWVTVPVCVVEKPGVGASLSRSLKLTKGFRWKIFGLLLLLGIINAVIRGAVGGGVTMAVPSQFIALVVTAVQAITVSLSAVVSAVGYHDLRRAAEGIDTEQLASVFD